LKRIVQVVLSFIFLVSQVVCSFAQTNPSSFNVTSVSPPFVREGDKPFFQFLLSNSTKFDWAGTGHFTLNDSATKEAVDGWFFNSLGNQYFTIDALKKDFVRFPLEIPFNFNKKAQWKFCAIAKTDTLCSQGQLRILPWRYENEESSLLQSAELPVVRKKLNGESVEDLVVVQNGGLINVEVEILRNQYTKQFEVKENLPAGISIDPESLLVKGDRNNILFEGKHLKKEELENAHDFVLKIDFSSTRIIRLSYQMRAIYPGTYHVPPTELHLTDSITFITRSPVGVLTIE
jgi:hypothetical protein